MMLSKFTSSVTGGSFDKKAAMLGVVQFLLPLAVLFGCALLIRGGLLWAAIGMTASLTLCALVKFFLARKAGS
ncbi:MAG: hypothetical protein LBH28_09475 [Oscillospiraceae bacterium]|nr:hypothetical protein [Oscillospiraceae bacterium]